MQFFNIKAKKYMIDYIEMKGHSLQENLNIGRVLSIDNGVPRSR